MEKLIERSILKNMKKTLYMFLKILNWIFVGITLIILILGIVSPDTITNLLTKLEEPIKSIESWNFWILGIVSVLESFPFIWAVFPGMSIVILIASFYLNQSPTIALIWFVVVFLGSIIGNALGFFLGKYVGRDFLLKYGIWFWVGKTELEYLEKISKKDGIWFLIFAKFHNLLRALLPYIIGASRLNNKKFWLANTLWAAIWWIFIIGIGYFFGEYYEVILKYFWRIMLTIIILVIGYIYLFQREKFTTYIEKKNSEIS